MDHTDHCSCIKDRGCFGAFGLHWLVWDEAFTERRVMTRLSGPTDAQCEEYLRIGTNQEKRDVYRLLLASRNGYREQMRHYHGTEFAYERCPAWERTYREQMARDKANRTDAALASTAGTRLRR